MSLAINGERIIQEGEKNKKLGKKKTISNKWRKNNLGRRKEEKLGKKKVH